MGCTCDNCGCSGSENIVQIIGQKGEKGDNGATPTIQAGTTTTISPGEDADVELVSNGNNSYVYNFNIPAGESGADGINGNNGWSPILAVVIDGAREVLQIVSWTGGSGTPPSSTNQFIGAIGIVSTAAAAVNIKGSAGASATGGVPIGCSIEYGGVTDLSPDPDTGAIFFIEDGRAISRTTYATLFTRIGTRFGAGNGTTTFNIPNSYGKIAIGLDSTVTALNTIGKTGGSITVTLSDHNLPVISPWGITDPGHVHNEQASTSVGGSIGLDSTGGRSGQGNMYLTTVSALTGISVNNNAGGGQALNILNPFIVKYKLIRVL